MIAVTSAKAACSAHRECSSSTPPISSNVRAKRHVIRRGDVSFTRFIVGGRLLLAPASPRRMTTTYPTRITEFREGNEPAGEGPNPSNRGGPCMWRGFLRAAFLTRYLSHGLGSLLKPHSRASSHLLEPAKVRQFPDHSPESPAGRDLPAHQKQFASVND